MPLTLSCVSFLNSLPFVEGLRRLDPGERPILLLDPPFRCAERLRRGEVDAALVPSVEFAAMEGALRAGEAGIASRHEVRSVVLLSRRPFDSLRSVAVDSNSRTSVALLRLVLSARFGSRPAFRAAPPDLQRMLTDSDAALLIGDAALRADRSDLRVLDLAAAWHGMTGLPFVFALWAARGEEIRRQVAPLLARSIELGRAAIREGCADAEASRGGLSVEDLNDYLERNIHFTLGGEEMESLRLFFEMCRSEGILGEAVRA